jgi:hypothetical protein
LSQPRDICRYLKTTCVREHQRSRAGSEKLAKAFEHVAAKDRAPG